MNKPTLTRKSVEKILTEIKCPFTGFDGGIPATVDKIEQVHVKTPKGFLKRYRVRLSERHGGIVISHRLQWRAFHENKRQGMFRLMLNRLDEMVDKGKKGMEVN